MIPRNVSEFEFSACEIFIAWSNTKNPLSKIKRKNKIEIKCEKKIRRNFEKNFVKNIQILSPQKWIERNFMFYPGIKKEKSHKIY